MTHLSKSPNWPMYTRKDMIFPMSLAMSATSYGPSHSGLWRHNSKVSWLMRKNKRHQNAYFAAYGFKILCEISKVPFEISHKILNPYTAKCEFYEVLKIWRLMMS